LNDFPFSRREKLLLGVLPGFLRAEIAIEHHLRDF
jgi:hypothetical protein